MFEKAGFNYKYCFFAELQVICEKWCHLASKESWSLMPGMEKPCAHSSKHQDKDF